MSKYFFQPVRTSLWLPALSLAVISLFFLGLREPETAPPDSQHSQSNSKESPNRTVVTVHDGTTYLIEYGASLQVSSAKWKEKKETGRPIELRKSSSLPEPPLDLTNKQIRDLKAADWMQDGFVLALTVWNSQEKRHEYYWATYSLSQWAVSRIDLTTNEQETPYSILAVSNQPLGDSIMILLHRTIWEENSAIYDTLTYRHDCPIPGVANLVEGIGKFYRANLYSRPLE